MRIYGRFLKNIAAVVLLLALVSLFLPFCKFSVDGQEISLSGLDVARAGGRAGYTYFTKGGIGDSFVLKDPITVGVVKSSLSYVQGTGHARLLALAVGLALIPVLLCFLSMVLLFFAEGKKTMVLPTLFTSAVLAELLVFFAAIPALQPFLLTGLYLFFALHGIAWILIVAGWVTGGYRRQRQWDLEQDIEEPKERKSRKERRRLLPERKKKRSGRRRRSKKKRSRSRSASQKETKRQEPTKKQPKEKTFTWNGCQITYEPEEQTYRIVNGSKQDIILAKDGGVAGIVKPGEKVRIKRPLALQMRQTNARMRLK